MTNWHETQSSTQVFDKLYHHLIGSLLEFQLVPPQFLVRLEKIIMILYPDIVRKIAENEGGTWVSTGCPVFSRLLVSIRTI